MCGNFCIAFIDFMLNGKNLLDYTPLNYIEHFLILASSIAGYISISASVSLFGVLIGITSSAIGLKICAITRGFKRLKSIIKKKKKKHEKNSIVVKI